MLKQFSLEMGEAGAASYFGILDFDIINRGLGYCHDLTAFHFGFVCSLHGGVYARAKKHAVKDVSSY